MSYTDYKPLRDKGRNYANSSGQVISKRQYDKLRRGGISNEVYADARAGRETRKQSELVEAYYRQWFIDFPKATTPITKADVRRRLKGIKKKLNSSDLNVRRKANLQLQTKAIRDSFYHEYRRRST